MGSQSGAFGPSNNSSFDEFGASTFNCSYGSTLEFYDRSAFNSFFSSTRNKSFSSTRNEPFTSAFKESFSSTLNDSFASTVWKDIQNNHTSIESSIIVRDVELHGVCCCSDTAVENQAKID